MFVVIELARRRPPSARRAGFPSRTLRGRVTARLPWLAVGVACTLGAMVTPAVAQPPTSTSTSPSLARLVDTRTATSGRGNTFPGAEVPFGMIQWSPDTKPTYTDGGGYDYRDTQLWGYSLTHLSGAGCPAAGDVPMVPLTGPLPTGDPNAITTRFSHSGEVAQAGYYSAQSDQPSTITSEFTATPHSSMGRFTYPATPQADFVIKLMASQHGDHGDSAQIIGNNEVEGSETSGDFCGQTNNAGQPQLYTLYFDIVFDQPFTASQVITNPGQANPAAVALTFNTTHDPVLRAKVGISYVSTADARLNWQKENPGWNFDAERQRAQTTWSRLLGRIQVSGGRPAQTQEFYSLLYKDFLQPNITSDVNGQFMGADLKTHTLATGQAESVRHVLRLGHLPLAGAIAGDARPAPPPATWRSRCSTTTARTGVLPQWGYNNLNNYVMVGDPADAMIADYYAFGARNFNHTEALTDMLAQATTVNDVRPGEALEQALRFPARGRRIRVLPRPRIHIGPARIRHRRPGAGSVRPRHGRQPGRLASDAPGE